MDNDPTLEQLYTSYLEAELSLNLEGQWFHNGTPFSHTRLSQLFHRSIKWDEELKQYTLRIGKGRATFTHAGFVRFVTSLSDNPADSPSTLLAHFADGSNAPLDPSELRLGSADEFLLFSPPKPKARFTRHAQQQILQYAESERSIMIGDQMYIIKTAYDE